MKGLDKIIGRIRADAQAEIDAICAEGEERAAAIAADYQARAEALRKSEEEKSRQAAQALLERGERGDAMDTGMAVLAAKQAGIDEAFALAAQKLSSLDDEERAAVLAAMAASAGSGDEELIFSAHDAATIGEAVVEKANALKGGSFTLSAETRPLEGGVILKKGDVEINCTFATALRLLRQTMAAEVAAILFQ